MIQSPLKGRLFFTPFSGLGHKLNQSIMMKGEKKMPSSLELANNIYNVERRLQCFLQVLFGESCK